MTFYQFENPNLHLNIFDECISLLFPVILYFLALVVVHSFARDRFLYRNVTCDYIQATETESV
jgi:hypothetical protein